MIRRTCAYGLKFKESDGLMHDSCTLIQALELEDKTSIHPATGKAPAMLEKGWNPRLPYYILKYAKERWENIYKPPEFKMGSLVL
ncbi:hypothetical protein O181_112078 [Austropuccinia psidii MF-1]|uniref:Uncharacterized protein n=1 Tax=Austropuccinia psidii MF-1 TaxID=1389203 RepID=A0A9Q3JZS5_9BASI|nr:hypothetical protein [Austropuccinia psidii MF-1]